MMVYRTHLILMFSACFCLGLLTAGTIDSVYAEQRNIKTTQKTAPGTIQGRVTEVIDASGYTYAEVDTGKKKVWAAGPTTALKIGDNIAFTTEMPMENFHSKSMNRDFPVVYFVGGFITDKETLKSKPDTSTSPHKQSNKQQLTKPIKGINKAVGGITIAEIYAKKNTLKGKTVRVRGQVTKFTEQILGKNWIHIRDSSTLDDLTVTTDDTVAINDIVIIEGKVELDKNFNYGYFYPIIVENAKVTKD